MVTMPLLAVPSHAENPKNCRMQCFGSNRNPFYIGRMAIWARHAILVANVAAFQNRLAMFHHCSIFFPLLKLYIIFIIKIILVKVWGS